MAHKWKKKSPMSDGSGVIEVNGQEVKVVVQDLVSVKHRVAFVDGVEVTRSGTFPGLLRKLEKQFPPVGG